MDPHERATSVWYRVAGLLRRKELAIDIIASEIRSAQHEVWLEAAKLVLTGDALEIARRMHDRAERVIRPELSHVLRQSIEDPLCDQLLSIDDGAAVEVGDGVSAIASPVSPTDAFFPVIEFVVEQQHRDY